MIDHPAFDPQVGDRVRILSFDVQPQTVGEVVTIVSIDHDRTWPYEVVFDGNKWPRSALKLAEIGPLDGSMP